MSAIPERRAGRLARLRPDELDPAQDVLHRAITGGARASGPRLFPLVDGEGRLEGPFDAMLRQPAIGTALQELGTAIRYRGVLPDRAREIAILLVGHHWASTFEVYAHEAVGAAAGLSPAELDALRDGRIEEVTGDVERAVARTTAALLDRADLTDAGYADAQAAIGVGGVVELTTLVGYYATLALQMRVFGVDAP